MTPGSNRTNVGLKRIKSHTPLPLRQRSNRTNVGLKPAPARSSRCSPLLGSNRTNVGLKPLRQVCASGGMRSSNRTNVGLKLSGVWRWWRRSFSLKSDQCGIETRSVTPEIHYDQKSSNRTNVGLKRLLIVDTCAHTGWLKSDQCGIETRGWRKCGCWGAAAQIGPMWD